ncbi:efflux RND transporter permease subunit [Natronospora cellulosivora (SeqCode)]
MKLSEIAIKRPVTTIMMVLLILILGIISFTNVSLDLLPDITFPMVAVMTDYDGVGPEEIETMVTRPLEGAVSTVTNVNSVSSSSQAGRSRIMVSFNWGTDMDIASMNIRERVDMVKGFLPDDAGEPLIVTFDPSMMPIMQIGVTSDLNLADLKSLMEDNFISRLERLDGVAQVDLIGGLEREIVISLDQSKMNNYQIDYSTVVNQLIMENINLSGGNLSRGSTDYLIRIMGKFSSVDEIGKVLIPSPAGMISLDEIAEVTDTYKEMTSISRLNGVNSVALSIQKQTDANTVAVSNAVTAEIERIQSNLDRELQIIPIMDQADFIRISINSVAQSAVIGGILAIIILLLFLKNIRSTIIIATSIPVSIITTFLFMYFGDLTLNMMTLGGLALGIGMLVDNSIVVLENIFRFQSEGYNKIEAAIKGSQEVGMAIVASTLTTIVVFLPIVFMGGIAAELFQELALTVTFSLLSSLLVSLTLIPVMASIILKLDNNHQEKVEKAVAIKAITLFYRRTLSWCLNRKYLVLSLSILVLIISISLFPFIGAEFIPDMDMGQLTIDIDLPVGTTLEEANRISLEIEDKVKEISEVEGFLTNVGSSGDMFTSSNSITVLLRDERTRERSTNQIVEQLREELVVAGADISINLLDALGADALGGGRPVGITIRGDDLNVLEELLNNVRKELAVIEGLRDIEDTLSEGYPEYQIHVNRSLASRFALTPAQIANAVRSAVSGDIATRYEIAGEEIDIRVNLKEENIANINQLRDILIPSPTGAKVPLERLANFSVEQGPQAILRENQVRYAELSAGIYNTDLGSIMPIVQERINDNIDIPEGYQLEYGGEYNEMEEAFESLFYALLLSIVLVYMVMASQFESLLSPFIVMFTVPMAAIGVLFALFLTGFNLSIVTIIGIIMLAGIVVNNAIVLLDYINTLQETGMGLKETLVEAGAVRLRPILMTTLTTTLALFPLALGIGQGTEMQQPMAVVVIGGLLVSTFLTLYLLPLLYSILLNLKDRIKIAKDLSV